MCNNVSGGMYTIVTDYLIACIFWHSLEQNVFLVTFLTAF